jgi:hypothetical protein
LQNRHCLGDIFHRLVIQDGQMTDEPTVAQCLTRWPALQKIFDGLVRGLRGAASVWQRSPGGLVRS